MKHYRQRKSGKLLCKTNSPRTTNYMVIGTQLGNNSEPFCLTCRHCYRELVKQGNFSPVTPNKKGIDI